MLIAVGFIRMRPCLPILKVELFSLGRLEENVLVDQLLKFIKTSNGKIIPWEEKEAYPTDIGNRFPLSTCCFLEFKSFNELEEFEEKSNGYEFFQN